MTFTQTFGAFVTTAALLSSLTLTAQPATAAPVDGWTVTGAVVAGSGSKVVIEPSVWPLPSLDRGTGSRVAMLELAPVVTDTGNYQISIARAAVPARGYIARDGSISVRLVISDGTSAEIQEVTLDPVAVVTAEGRGGELQGAEGRTPGQAGRPSSPDHPEGQQTAPGSQPSEAGSCSRGAEGDAHLFESGDGRHHPERSAAGRLLHDRRAGARAV